MKLFFLKALQKTLKYLTAWLYTHRIEIFNPSHDPHGHFATISGRLGARVQGGAETFADLLDAGLQLVSLEEDDEDGLVNLIRLEKEGGFKVLKTIGFDMLLNYRLANLRQ